METSNSSPAVWTGLPNSAPPPPAPVEGAVSENEFIADQTRYVTPAADDLERLTNGEEITMVLPEPETVVYDKSDEPNFFASAEGNDTAKETKPLSKKVIDSKARFVIKFQEWGMGELFAAWAGEEEVSAFDFDDEEKAMLAEAWEPILEKHGGKIPWWAEFGFVQFSLIAPRFKLARKLRKLNRENAELRNSLATMQNAAGAVNAMQQNGGKARTSFKIDKNGYYEKDVYGKYIPKADRTEKASLKDVAELIFSNGWETIQQLFGLPTDYREKNGIEIDE